VYPLRAGRALRPLIWLPATSSVCSPTRSSPLPRKVAIRGEYREREKATGFRAYKEKSRASHRRLTNIRHVSQDLPTLEIGSHVYISSH
jgi:hypothetical protein